MFQNYYNLQLEDYISLTR